MEGTGQTKCYSVFPFPDRYPHIGTGVVSDATHNEGFTARAPYGRADDCGREFDLDDAPRLPIGGEERCDEQVGIAYQELTRFPIDSSYLAQRRVS